MSGYDGLSACYDSFFSEKYKRGIVSKYMRILSLNGKKNGTVLDLGCGTGLLSIPLLKSGYRVICIDSDEKMLQIAKNKASTKGLKGGSFICSDIIDMKLDIVADAAVSSLDVMNHITEKAKLLSAFSNIFNHLVSGGLFVFDVNSQKKFERQYAKNSYEYKSYYGHCIWCNDYDVHSKLCKFTVDVLDYKCGRHRVDIFYERYYSDTEIIDLLCHSGFKNISMAAADRGGRHIFTAHKI